MGGLRLETRQRCALAQRLILGGATDLPTVFPLTAKVLKRTSTQEMLYEKYRLDDSERGYRSVMDQLLCETLAAFRPACVAFYGGDGPPFRDLYGADYRHKIDLVLVGYLRVARALAKKKLWGGEFPQWCALIETIRDLSSQGGGA